MIELDTHLNKHNWAHKRDLYNEVFTSVDFKNVIQNPKASIIIISWRYIDEIHENMVSLKKQRNQVFELIFVNNGKDDAEFEKIMPFIDTYVKLNCNTGAYKARNIGAIFAKAPVLIFLEDDGIADPGFIKAHLESYSLYEAISVRGVCKPLTNNEYNKNARHYNLGRLPFPRFVDLEGNASYKAAAFFEVGGWNDDIQFGYGGPDLAIRLGKKYPDKRLQIYSPYPVISHDYAKGGEHLEEKKKKQKASLAALKVKYLDWDTYFNDFKSFNNKGHLLLFKSLKAPKYLYNYGIFLLRNAIRRFL